ncbi:MAG: hypothetical protein JWO36_4741 [Myxococcales bacterium]|nr:hypothetical protein [Myxococcales bacterium]
MKTVLSLLAITAACATAPRRFPLRAPLTIDTDLAPVSLPCRPDPTPKQPEQMRCMPAEYVSPFAWNQIENTFFARLSRFFSIDIVKEAENANSLDEVADSSWFTNRIGEHALTIEQKAAGGCKPEDFLPPETDVPDGAWVIDKGKANGSTPGFRIDVPGKGKYLLKADTPGEPERASAAEVIGAALYHAVGFSTSCEQVVYIRPSQLELTPGLISIDNAGVSHPFDAAALQKVLSSSTPDGKLVRMAASKWLPGVPLGPFRYEGVRDDDPNDIIPHENRRELRGSKLLAAWMNHWDAREQNSMDLWFASNEKAKQSSPGVVRHYVIDTSDTLGGPVDPRTSPRLGYSYTVDFGSIFTDLVTFGLVEHPWDRVEKVHGREKFGFFAARDFDPAEWKTLYPNPAFLRMTERDGAWMARLIARFGPEDVRAIMKAGHFKDQSDVDYLTQVMIDRQKIILARYLTVLSPIADIQRQPDGRLCGVDLARLRGVFPETSFHYTAVQIAGHQRWTVPVAAGPEGAVCISPQSFSKPGIPDDAPERLAVFRLDNGTDAGPLEIHAYDLGLARGMRVVGLIRYERRQ